MSGLRYATDHPNFFFHHKKGSQGDISILKKEKKLRLMLLT